MCLRRFLFLLIVITVALPQVLVADHAGVFSSSAGKRGIRHDLFESEFFSTNLYAVADSDRSEIVVKPFVGGIKEEVPAKYRPRFEKWKAELLSTDIGREQWNSYAGNRNFQLTIKVTDARGKGAGTDKFIWNDDGNFVGATITLGSEIDQGFPTPVYYPVLNSLSAEATHFAVSGTLLAATKISHEIGHVNQTARVNRQMFEIQNRLMPIYISIFLKNGLNTKDRRLVDLADQMGGTPVEIWESREYWSEVNAMLFLKERIGNEESSCRVFDRIRQNLNAYAREYQRRFTQHPEIASLPCWK